MSLLREARALLESADELIRQCSITTGACCCGDEMANHSDPMICGHSAVDQGTYYASNLQERIKELLQRLPPTPLPPAS